ncbi:hypothetical protein ACIQTW_19640 [Paenarthrobacter sp. NPDC090517]|uniref:hypothetical protein n=1 Tax=Paenarthrobacter sp. NPDC090517 TaxID=3364381 RepID=UPI0037F9C00C
MGLDFADAGNGPEVLWAGMFTVIAVVGSVLLSLWSQRRDFQRREEELKSTFAAQEQAAWAGWRRQIAERALLLVTKACDVVMMTDPDAQDTEAFRLFNEAREVEALLSLDRSGHGRMLGEWLGSQVFGILNSRFESEAVMTMHDIADKTRERIVKWSLDPSPSLVDSKTNAPATLSGIND